MPRDASLRQLYLRLMVIVLNVRLRVASAYSSIQSNARTRSVSFNNIAKEERECMVFFPFFGCFSFKIYLLHKMFVFLISISCIKKIPSYILKHMQYIFLMLKMSKIIISLFQFNKTPAR